MQKPHQSSAAAAAAAAAFQLTLSQRKRSVYSDTHRERKRGKEKGLPNKRTSSSPLKSHFAGREPVRAAKSTPDQTDVLFPRFRRALVCFPVLSRVARAAKRAESCCRCRALRSSCFINDALSSQVNSPARARARLLIYTPSAAGVFARGTARLRLYDVLSSRTATKALLERNFEAPACLLSGKFGRERASGSANTHEWPGPFSVSTRYTRGRDTMGRLF